MAKLDQRQETDALTLGVEALAHQQGMEASYARDGAQQGLDHYREAFLSPASHVLNEGQWSQLARFESTQQRTPSVALPAAEPAVAVRYNNGHDFSRPCAEAHHENTRAHACQKL